MRLIRRPNHSIPDLRNGCVATIGAFDGLHIGHRQILDRVQLVAAEQQLPSLVFSFEPLPKEYFSQGLPPARLMKFREKFQALDELGFDWFFCPPNHSSRHTIATTQQMPGFFQITISQGLAHN